MLRLTGCVELDRIGDGNASLALAWQMQLWHKRPRLLQTPALPRLP